MMNGRFWVISILTLVAVALLGVRWVLPTFFVKQTEGNWKDMRVGDHSIKVMVADDPDEMDKGLGYREGLGENEGMVFLYLRPVLPRFWMKGMRFDLDFIWIRDGVVVEIIEQVPAPVDDSTVLEFIQPQEPITWVLEVNAGFVEKNGIRVGDLVTLK